MTLAPQLRPGLVAREPIDSDIDLRTAPRRRHHLDDASTLAVIAVGGALGVLGGFTTSSTYSVDTAGLITTGHVDTALLYFGVTVVAALFAVWRCAGANRRLLTWRSS